MTADLESYLESKPPELLEALRADPSPMELAKRRAIGDYDGPELRSLELAFQAGWFARGVHELGLIVNGGEP